MKMDKEIERQEDRVYQLILDQIQELIKLARLKPSYSPCYLFEMKKVIDNYLGNVYRRDAIRQEEDLAKEAKQGRYRGGW